MERTLARASASGMSLSASLEKSFSGFNRPADMMTRVDGRLFTDSGGSKERYVGYGYTALHQTGNAVFCGSKRRDDEVLLEL